MSEKKEKVLKQESIPPMGLKMIFREFLKDKMAIFSLVLLVAVLLFVFIGSAVIDQSQVMRVSILDKYAVPGAISPNGGTYLLGFSITIITSIVGVGLGIISGYYGGIIDNILMRIVDFVMILPIMLIIIVIVSIVPRYNVWTFIWVMSAFYWVGKARLFRSKTLSEGRRDYVSASKTLGTNDFVIMFREIMPNLSSLIITNLTMNFAANIGIETTLTFLGFGLPTNVPSLGTLIGYASSGDVLVNRQWIWLPASILILVLMLSINYVGQAFKRSADARQRLG